MTIPVAYTKASGRDQNLSEIFIFVRNLELDVPNAL